MAKLTFEVLDADVRNGLRKLDAATGDISPALAVIGRKTTSRIRLGFRASESPYGQPWAPLQHRIGQPLRDTGRLQSSITYRTGGASGDQYVDVGTNTKYAKVHQYGATILPKNGKYLVFMSQIYGLIKASKVVIPARPFLPIQNDEFVMPEEWAKDATVAMYNHLKRTGVL